MTPLPCDEADRIELGLRAAMALRAENRGVATQRASIFDPWRPWQAASLRPGWVIRRGGDGTPLGMVWHERTWGADA